MMHKEVISAFSLYTELQHKKSCQNFVVTLDTAAVSFLCFLFS